MELLVAESIEGCTKATHFDGTISHDPARVIITFGENNGFVGRKSLLGGVEGR